MTKSMIPVAHWPESAGDPPRPQDTLQAMMFSGARDTSGYGLAFGYESRLRHATLLPRDEAEIARLKALTGEAEHQQYNTTTTCTFLQILLSCVFFSFNLNLT